MTIKASLLLLPAVLAFFSATAQSTTLSTTEFASQAKQNGAQLLDVRSTDEYRSGHIAQSVQADWNNAARFKDHVQYLDKSKPVYVYCAAGVRSKAAAAWLRQNGYSNVYELNGGLNKWKAENNPVEKIPEAPAISTGEYNKKTAAAALVLVDFSAGWCLPCRKMEPVIQQLQAALPNTFTLVKIDAGTQAALLKEMQVTDIPAFILYKNGKEVWRKQGVQKLDELKKEITGNK